MTRGLLLLLLAGCGGGTSAKGEVGGEPVNVREAFYVQEDGAWADGDRVRVYVFGVSDACAAQASYVADLQNDATAADSAASWEAAFPKEFWSIDLDLRLDDVAAPGGQYEGRAWDEELTGSGQVQAEIAHYVQLLDERYWESSAPDEEYVSRWLTDGGSLDLSVDEGVLEGRFEADAVDFEGNPAGDLRIDFEATRCASLEEL
jgi:hypothetical protein